MLIFLFLLDNVFFEVRSSIKTFVIELMMLGELQKHIYQVNIIQKLHKHLSLLFIYFFKDLKYFNKDEFDLEISITDYFIRLYDFVILFSSYPHSTSTK